jgi:Zn-dependent M28 family amino/carboxypeptidase
MCITIDYKMESFNSYNIIAVTPGTDGHLKKETIVVGAHLDHIGKVGKHIYNGANDDGSGCIAALEAAKATAKNPLKRPVMFVFYTGEELNLIGSMHFVCHPPITLENILMNINLEQLGSKHRSFKGVWAIGDAEFKKPFYKSGSVFADADLKFDTIDSMLEAISNCDTYSFVNKNVPSLLLGSGGFSEHHLTLDKINLIDFRHLRKSIMLLNSLVEELGNHSRKI